MLLEGRHLQFFVHRKLDPSSYVVKLCRLLPEAACKMKWNESGFWPPLCTYGLNWTRRTSWGWWDEWDETGFEIRALTVWGRARYLEAPHNTEFHTWMGKKHFCFFQTAETGNRTLAWKAVVLTTTTGPPPSGMQQCTYMQRLRK